MVKKNLDNPLDFCYIIDVGGTNAVMKTVLKVAPDGFVTFYIVEREVDEWTLETYDAYRYETAIFNKNPTGTVRYMLRMLVEYIGAHKPHVLFFKGNSDKKHRIYRKLLTKYLPKGYATVEHNGMIYLYKLEDG